MRVDFGVVLLGMRSVSATHSGKILEAYDSKTRHSDTKFVFLLTPSCGGISKQAKQKRKEQGTKPTRRESPSLIRKGGL